MVKPEYKKTLIEIILRHIPNCTIMLFGSRARKKHSEGSDIDLALDAGHKIDRTVLALIQDEIEGSKIPFFVDLVDMKKADEAIKSQIMKDKILWNI